MISRAPRSFVNALLVAVLLLTMAAPVLGRSGRQLRRNPGEVPARNSRPGRGRRPPAERRPAHGLIPGIDVQVVRVPAGAEQARVAAYQKNPNVLYAEVDGTYSAVGTFTPPPNDPYYSSQWQYNNTGQSGGTPDADIDAPEAWAVTTGSSTTKIAILDTGIDQSHPDLKAKIVGNKNFSTSKTFDDKYGHGTHVAGSAAAITNNGIGVAGTCPDCSLLNVKVLGDNGSGNYSWIANGIIWAADNGAKVINMSLGGSVRLRTLSDAIDYAWSMGVVVVAAAGNSSTSQPFYPAAYPNVIAVAATDRNDAMASFSNYGASGWTWPPRGWTSSPPRLTTRIPSGVAASAMAPSAGPPWPRRTLPASPVWSGPRAPAHRPPAFAPPSSRALTPSRALASNWASGRANAYRAVT